MSEGQYTAVPGSEDEKQEALFKGGRRRPRGSLIQSALGILGLVVMAFGLGFGAGWELSSSRRTSQPPPQAPNKNGLLPPQSFIPQIPIKEVVFDFPTDYADTGPLGDKLWRDLMPLGAGFLRVPFPRVYDQSPSKLIPGDHELAEIYSMSMTHQLHCLGLVRDVVTKYEVGSKSRFAGGGHEYHCIDYIRQAIMCAGDTTLDHADVMDASGRPSGFTGAGSAHQCRDWDTIKSFLVENRSGNKTGILKSISNYFYYFGYFPA